MSTTTTTRRVSLRRGSSSSLTSSSASMELIEEPVAKRKKPMDEVIDLSQDSSDDGDEEETTDDPVKNQRRQARKKQQQLEDERRKKFIRTMTAATINKVEVETKTTSTTTPKMTRKRSNSALQDSPASPSLTAITPKRSPPLSTTTTFSSPMTPVSPAQMSPYTTRRAISSPMFGSSSTTPIKSEFSSATVTTTTSITSYSPTTPDMRRRSSRLMTAVTTIKEEKQEEKVTLDMDDYEESDDEGEEDEEEESEEDQEPEVEEEEEEPPVQRRSSRSTQKATEAATKPKRAASSPNLLSTIKKERPEAVNPLSRSLSGSTLKKKAQRQRRSTAKKAIQKSKDMLKEASSEDDSSESEFEPEPVELSKSWGKQAESSDDEDEDELVEEEELSEEEEEEQEKKASRRRGGNDKKKKAKATPKKPRRKQLPNIYNPEHDEGDISPFKYVLKEAEQPSQIRIKMLGFQKESLDWMTEQEKNIRYRGGILADDMGMGKTLQAIALVVKSKYDLLEASTSTASSSSSSHHAPAVLPSVTTTLVVCPVVAIAQWETEIIKYTKEDTLKVLLYHGQRGDISADDLTSYDVVLTTYSVIESDFRRQSTGFRRKDKETGQNIYVKRPSLLHSIDWYRVILDEAHCIKDRSCSTARACFNLQSHKRWSLTGTPLQNRVGELYSLVRFLQITPYSYYYCKKCDCKSLFWKFEGRSPGSGCEGCGHTAMSHFSWWNKHVLNPIKKHGMEGEGAHAMVVLKSILQRIMLRRTKVEKAKDLCLPPRIITTRSDELNDEENDFYDALYTQSQTKFMGFVEAGTVLNNYANVFDLLLRLRQALDHPYLVLHRQDNGLTNTSNDICKICFDPAEDPVVSKCKHNFCRVCIETYMQTNESEKSLCPSCFRPLTIDLLQQSSNTEADDAKKPVVKSILQRIDLSNWRSSTKIEALMEELTKMRQKDGYAKALVFSQFVNFLDLIEWRLKIAGFGCVKLDGRMNQIQKAAAINKFNNDSGTYVFLISLKAGGVALNLTVANYCFLMDPWWNPAAEFQAIDRIHRLGQYKCVKVIRFVVPNTIEERIIQLQDKKHLLFQSTVGMDADALAKLTVADLQFLFGR